MRLSQSFLEMRRYIFFEARQLTLGMENMTKERRITQKIFYGIWTGFFSIFLFTVKPSYLHSSQLKPHLSISLSFGYFQPKEKAFKELYGTNKFQLDFNMRYALMKNLCFYSGLRYLSCEGETKIIGPAFEEEKYRLKFTMTSIPFGLIYSSAYKNLYPFFGGGVSYNIYREKWDELSVSFADEKLGLFLIGGVEYPINKRFSLLARAQYSTIPTKQGAELDKNINLGGTEFCLGFSFHF